MKIKKSAIATLLSLIFTSSVLQATEHPLDAAKFKAERIGIELINPDGYDWIDYHAIPLLSGDGKTFVFSEYASDDGTGEEGRLKRVLYDNDSKLETLPAKTYDLYRHRMGSRITISKDGSIILSSKDRGFYIRKPNDDKYVFHDLDKEYPKAFMLRVTGDGSILLWNEYEIGLLNPNTSEMKIPYKYFERYGWDYQDISLNHDGSVLVIPNDFRFHYTNGKTTVMYGDKWNKEVLLEEPSVNRMFPPFFDMSDHLSSSRPNPDGNIIMMSGDEGWIYSGQDFTEKTVLPKSVGDKENKDSSVWILTSNQNGSVLGGSIGIAKVPVDKDDPEGYIEARPILWYGKGWSKTKDIGTLGGKDTDLGIIFSMTYDGELIAGMSTNAEGKFVPTLWRFVDENMAPTLVDREKTKETIEKVGQKAFNLFQNQRYGLVNLLEGCRVENGQGHYCVSLRSSLWGQKQDREAKAGVSMAYALTDKFSVGGVIEHSIYSDILDTNKHRNLGLGLFAEWKTKQGNKEFYIRPALSFNRYHGNLERPMESGTEYGYGKINLKGTALSLTLGEKYNLATDVSLDWFAGVRYMNLKQKGYQDSAQAFPIEYKGMKYEEASIFAGLGFSKALTSKLNWLSKVEVEQVIHQRNPIFSATNEHLGKVEFKQKLARNSISLSSGLEYKLNENFKVSFVPGITKASAQPIRWNVGLNLTGQF